MQQILDQLLQLLQQGISAIFQFVRLIWTWSSAQITKVFQVPWESWPLWKQILLVLVVALVIWILFAAAKQLWLAGIRVLTAFAHLLGAFVVTLPTILLAGLVALGGLWALNNLNFSSLSLPVVFSGGDKGASNAGIERQARQGAGNKANEPGDSQTGAAGGDAR